MADQFASIDDYISTFATDVAPVLEEVRRSIRRAVPEPGEAIRYQMPTMTLEGRSLVHFAGWEHHVALYPAPDDGGQLEPELSRYRTGKSSLQFPLAEPVPCDLIERIAAEMVRQRERGET